MSTKRTKRGGKLGREGESGRNEEMSATEQCRLCGDITVAKEETNQSINESINTHFMHSSHQLTARDSRPLSSYYCLQTPLSEPAFRPFRKDARMHGSSVKHASGHIRVDRNRSSNLTPC
jgi:hypothetical protein